MDKQKEDRWTREIDLLSYYPEYLKDIREFKQICSTEAQEFYRLYEKSDQLWMDGFIRSASVQGIKRWEGLLGIKPFPGDSMEDRRSRILIMWNRQLPYTLLRLRERLELSVGMNHYQILIHYQDYKLEVLVDNQVYRVLCELREMGMKMIPANLLFIFAGRYPAEFNAGSRADLGMKMETEFYPRYNLAYHYWEGSHALGGGKDLNGYDGAALVDFYPVVQKSSMYVLPNAAVAPVLCGVAEVRCNAVMDAESAVMGEAVAAPQGLTGIWVAGNAEALTEEAVLITMGQTTAIKIEHGGFTEVLAGISGKVNAGVNQLQYSTVDARHECDAGMVFKAEIGTIGAAKGNCVYYRAEVSASPKVFIFGKASGGYPVVAGYKNELAVEKNLRFLEGASTLAGTSLLNADIFNHTL